MLNSILGTRRPTQIALVTNDIEATKKQFATFLGMEVPPTVDAGKFEVTGTEYLGRPSPEAGCNMAFFNLENITIELIQPNENESTWRDYLEAHGPSLHHIAFNVENIHEGMDAMKNAGFKLTQWGKYGGGDGAYAYFDCMKELNCFIELLCDFK